MKPANLPVWKYLISLLLSPLGAILLGSDVMLHLLKGEHYCHLDGECKLWSPVLRMNERRCLMAANDSKPVATSFRVEWSDGSVWTAEGETAAQVMDWYQCGEVLNCLYETVYEGPQITVSKPNAQGGPGAEPEVDSRPCQDCGGINPSWFAESVVWNAVFPERVGYVCPNCFIKRADPVIQNTGWKLVPTLGAVELVGRSESERSLREQLSRVSEERDRMKKESK